MRPIASSLKLADLRLEQVKEIVEVLLLVKREAVVGARERRLQRKEAGLGLLLARDLRRSHGCRGRGCQGAGRSRCRGCRRAGYAALTRCCGREKYDNIKTWFETLN